ncbi:MAG: flagellar protein export ATPase FliI [Gammaproteobacteria bacterium]|nr:flagellar protein export ATPase FliI [Gammaproteobacteria bacterium]
MITADPKQVQQYRQRWLTRLREHRGHLDEPPGIVVEGVLNRMVGLTLEAVGCQAAIGARCVVDSPGSASIEAEVVGFADERLYLMPTGSLHGIRPNARVIPTDKVYEAPVGNALLGRVLDGAGRPLDGKGPLRVQERMPLSGRPINPLQRQPIDKPLDVGVRSINALLTVGRGQRMGLFAGSGVGKSVLLGMMTKFTTADVIVVGLIGERGREVKEFINNILGEEGMARSVVVAVPADHTPVMRMHGAAMATTIAEYFRDQGKHVLLLMDSLTRYAQAQREIALAIGEPPATKGYPPSVFARLPQLVERAGNADQGGGSITAFYTVLTEGDDQQDPIADAARAILDGHIVLSRELAESGQYPAIDVEASISRVMTEIVDKDHLRLVQRFRQMYSLYRQNQDLINVGAYTPGTDSRIDESIQLHPALLAFLSQDMRTSMSWQESRQCLQSLFANHEAEINAAHAGMHAMVNTGGMPS